jgi:mgtE-like transporter
MRRMRRTLRLVDALRAERRTLRQGVVALALSTGAGLVAGLILSHLTGSLERLPGLLVLIPAAVAMRGTIFGALAARLGTSIHAGVFAPEVRRPGVLRDNVAVAIVTTLTSSVWLAVLARIASAAAGSPSISLAQLVVIAVVGGALGSIAILVLTIGLCSRRSVAAGTSTPSARRSSRRSEMPRPCPRCSSRAGSRATRG